MRIVIHEFEIKRIVLKYLNDEFDMSLTEKELKLYSDDFHNITAEYEVDVDVND